MSTDKPILCLDCLLQRDCPFAKQDRTEHELSFNQAETWLRRMLDEGKISIDDLKYHGHEENPRWDMIAYDPIYKLRLICHKYEDAQKAALIRHKAVKDLVIS